jgi:hypothetical protein
MQSYSLKPLDRKKGNTPFAVQVEWDDNWDDSPYAKGKHQKYIHFNMKDRTYSITDGELDTTQDVISLLLPIYDKHFFLLFCYDNGCVNKVPVSIFLSNRENWSYRNAFHANARLQAFLFGSDDDYVYCEIMCGNERRARAVSIKDIPTRKVLYTKGLQIIQEDFTKIGYWNIIVGKDIDKVYSLKNYLPFNTSISFESLWPDEICWLNSWKSRYNRAKRYDENLKSLKPLLLDVIHSKNKAAIKSVLLKQVGVDIGSCQECIENLVRNDISGEDYWFLALTVLEVNAEYYARPITNPIIQAKDKTSYFVTNLNQHLDKLSLVLDKSNSIHYVGIPFFLCFKSFVSEDCKERIRRNSKFFKTPDDYDAMFELLGHSIRTEVDTLLKDNTITSIFVLTKMYESNHGKPTRRNSFFRTDGHVTKIMSRIDDTSVYGRVSRQLLELIYYGQRPKSYREYSALVDLSKNLEYNRFQVFCKDIEGKAKEIISQQKRKMIGKEMQFVMANSYSNHYLLHAKNSNPPIKALLPINSLSKQLQEGDEISLFVISYEPKVDLLFVFPTKSSVIHYKQIPLVNEGDRLRIRFDNGRDKPSIINGLDCIKLKIVNCSQAINYNAVYNVKIVRRRSFFEADAEIINE